MFFTGLALVRFTGRRSFGLSMPFDNVITILLGAILSRPVVGASEFVPAVSAAAVIAGLHRLCAWIALYYDGFGRIIKGESKLLYREGSWRRDNMRKKLISEKDVMESVRDKANIDDLSKVKSIWLERDGQITVVKKNE